MRRVPRLRLSVAPFRHLGGVVMRIDVRVALLALIEAVALISNGTHLSAGQWTAQAAGLALAFAGLLLQFSRPGPGMVLVLAGTVAMPLDATSIWPLLAAVLQAALTLPVIRTAGWALAAVFALSLQRTTWSLGVGGFGLELLAVGLTAAVGLWVSSRDSARREREASQEERERLQSQRALAEERAAIAREVHDLVAHSLALTVVQAQLLAQRSDDPAIQNDAQVIAQHAREAVAELQRSVALIRGDAPRTPPVTIAALEPIIEQSRSAGLKVSFTSSGDSQPLPPAIAQSAVRIVQEALTNCAKYAPSANVSVLLDLEPHQLALQVIDDGPGASSHETGGGMGLVGMRERIAILGGTFDAASLQPRGFRVRVALPIPQQDAN